MDSPQRGTALDSQGRRSRRGALDARAHQAEGVHDATHRALAQGHVAGQLDIEGLTRQQAGQEADTGTRIAHVQCGIRCTQTVQPHATDGHFTVLGSLDVHAHGAKSRHRGQGILALEKSADTGGALGNRAEHDRAVGDRLVPRDPRLATDHTAGH